jgi:hypothetical protein
MVISEKLYIRNFLTIKKFDWDIKDFNALTGCMGSGKSICVKLLYFLESILHTLIFDRSITREDLDISVFFDNIGKEFTKLFPGENFGATEIEYTWSYGASVFDLKARWDADENCLRWSSDYLAIHLGQWQEFFGKEDTVNKSGIVCSRIYESVNMDFAGPFPIGTIFIPASRAIAAITDNTDFPDPFLVDFIKNLKKFVLRFDELSNESINNILHVKNMRYEKERGLRITLSTGCEIPPLALSSGQQELLYLALLVGHLIDTGFSYANSISVFIEEPEAHLFPQEQKSIIEYVVEVFRKIQQYSMSSRQMRFFITTHSPYVLNVMSTMMNRGRLKKEADKSNNVFQDSFHYFNQGDVSAYFIDTDGIVVPIVSEDESFLNAEAINNISQIIFDEANSVDDMLADIKAREAP